jgi:hypothetical protein
MARKNRTKLITLDETTFELAVKKTNFSAWVRAKLRSERNKTEVITRRCTYCYGVFEAGPTFYDHVCNTSGQLPTWGEEE